MPATRTRSSSQQRSRQATSPTRNLPGRPTPEVIVLSSDDENAQPSEIGSSRSNKKIVRIKKPIFTRRIKKPRFPMGQVLEISSSDEGPVLPKAPGNDGSSWQQENSKLKQTNERLERQVADQREQLNSSNKRLEEQGQELVTTNLEIYNVRRELQEHQEKLAALKAKDTSEPSIGATKLGDMLSCDICTHLMHSPYLLTDCGHCYCEGCLKGWFNQTLTNHIRAYPAYNMNRRPVPRNFPQVLHTISPYVSYPIQMQLQAMYNTSRQQQPEYTCPGCRKEVTGKPVVNFHIKDMVSVVGGVLGQPDTGREFFNTGGQQAGPFDRFFPR